MIQAMRYAGDRIAVPLVDPFSGLGMASGGVFQEN